MNEKIALILKKIQNLFVWYPLVLLMSFGLASVIIYAIENNLKKDPGFFCLKIGFIFGLGISLMFALKMLSQRIKKGYLFEILGLLILFGYYFIFPEKEEDFTEVYAFILVPTFILSHLLVAFVPYLKKENSEKSFWQYNKNLFVNFVLTLIFTGVLVGGVELAIVSVENLFNLDFNSETYAEVFFSLSIIGSAIIFLLFNETGLEYLEKDGSYPIVLKFFTQFILIPLLLIYAVILYFYSGKILINWELPRGWVSYLVLAYSIVGILALLLVHPLKEEKAKSWVKMFSKIFYYTLIPLIILLFIAIFTRVLEYGYTEPRYFVLLLALWLTTVVFYFIFKRNATIKFIPISLFLFGLFALTFPYFNTFSLSKRSQKNELEKILTENQLLVNGKIDFNKEVVDTVKTEIENKFKYLNDRHEENFLVNFMSKKPKSTENKYWFYDHFKNIRYTTTNDYDPNNRVIRLRNTADYFDISGYQYIINKENYETNIDKQFGEDNFKIENSGGKNPSYQLTINSKTIELFPKIKELCKNKQASENEQETTDLFIETDWEGYHIKIIFESIQRFPKDETYYIQDAVYLIKKN
ncbi:DUF4153 domain-containing protein [Flavobacterium sp.]|uniref:DUF4153 domain-containing protein n=1 Tax=Flavobacterium sp. TaxID=239 RepID=UPI0028BD7323|nr:DUF4153 domain-containing protein [Flavobacterium sp.]